MGNSIPNKCKKSTLFKSKFIKKAINKNLTVDLLFSNETNHLENSYIADQLICNILIKSLYKSNALDLPFHHDKGKNAYNDHNEESIISARVWVAQCKIYGFGIQKNESEGFQELIQLKDFQKASYPLACYYYHKKEYSNAYIYFYKIRKSNSAAQYRLALMLFHGQGTISNYKKAIHYMKLAASNGNKYAQYALGYYYENGIGVEVSILDAKFWYQKSANQGSPEAQLSIADLLLKEMIKLIKLGDKSSSFNIELLKRHSINWLHKSAEQGNPTAHIRLASLYASGIITQKSLAKAIMYYDKAIDLLFSSPDSQALAHYLVGIKYRLEHTYLSKNNELIIHHLSKSSSLGYPPAQRALGLMYARGIGITKSSIKSRHLFQKASIQDTLKPQPTSIDHDFKKAITPVINFYEQMADTGSISAQVSLAELFLRAGQFDLAFKWFETASKNTLGTENTSDPKDGIHFLALRNTAALMVARCRYHGLGTKRDPILAFRALRALSDQGFLESYYWLAVCYEEGVRLEGSDFFIEPDMTVAFGLYKKSAEVGDIDGQFQMAYMLFNGLGTQKDQMAAFPWYQRAADKGHSIAQYTLGVYYENGIGLPNDLKVAEKWYRTAAEKNSQVAMIRLAKVLVLLDTTNVDQAIYWLKRAIGIGSVLALRELAIIYSTQRVIHPEGRELSLAINYQLSFNYYKQAAEKNDALSWYALYKFYQGCYNVDEFKVLESIEKCADCLKKSNGLGYDWAAIDLADLYRKNRLFEEAMGIYVDIIQSSNEMSELKRVALLEAAKLCIFEDYGNENEKSQAYELLLDFISDRETYENGMSIALELIGYCLENGIGIEKNTELAIQFYIDCVNEKETNNIEHTRAKKRSLSRLVYIYVDQERYIEAYSSLEALIPDIDYFQLAETPSHRKYPCSLKLLLGRLLINGLGIEKNVSKGLDWILKAGEDGEGEAYYELGTYHMKHTPSSKYIIKDYFKQGAILKNPGCMRQLAIILLENEVDREVLNEDYDGGAEILYLLESASKMNDEEATYQLGLAYEKGLGDVIPVKNVEKALDYFMIAANSDHELAILKSAEILSDIMSRHDEAIELFQKADILYNNIKAKVMLISYNFQGYHISRNNETESEMNDLYNFRKLRDIIDKEVNIIKNGNDPFRKIGGTGTSVSDKSGLGLAFYILGQCHEIGKGTSVDLSMAKKCYLHSVNVSEHVDAMWRLGVLYKEKEKDYEKALQWFRYASEKGRHCESLYQIGLFHLYGVGSLEVQMSVAKRYFIKAVEQGHPIAMFELAKIIWSLDKDYFYAYQLFKTAGEEFCIPPALRELGHVYHTGYTFEDVTLTQKNHKLSFGYYWQAAQMGDPISALMVGSYFERGYIKEGLEQNFEKALQWYETAYRLNCGGLSELAIGKLKHVMSNKMGDTREAEDIREEAFAWFESAAEHLADHIFAAKIMIALYYLNGWGRKAKNTKLGFRMLSDIANLGSSDVYKPLAQCYEQGVGTEYNMDKALEYWMKAAELGDPVALNRLGEIYDFGLNGVIDKKTADVYYTKAKKAKPNSIIYTIR